jgi:chromosome segregation protein
VIAARPDERRQLFEEAAQISRYRMRRRESEKRLEESRHHLDRIGDIVRELEARMRQLERQKNVALRHDELQAQLYGLDRWRFVHQGRELAARIRKARDELDSIEDRTPCCRRTGYCRTVAQDIQLQKMETEGASRSQWMRSLIWKKRMPRRAFRLQLTKPE